MFKFEFEREDGSNATKDPMGSMPLSNLRPCVCHDMSRSTEILYEHDEFNILTIGDTSMKFLKQNTVKKKLCDSKIGNLLQSSDLVSGTYEGGLKVWECTYDLLNYIYENRCMLRGARILDLGCGAGLLGIYGALQNAGFVCLQDYNSEVIEEITLPNCNTSLRDTNFDCSEQILLVSGDWDGFCAYCSQQGTKKFDVILSSETIYNVSYYHKIHGILKTLLQPSGAAYFAAKTHYFGVGGGTLEFTTYLNNCGMYKVDTVYRSSSGVLREILKVSLFPSSSVEQAI